MATLLQRLRNMSPQLLLYFIAVAFVGMAGGCFNTSYNNFLNDVFHIGAESRGMLEFPREMPGFLVAAMTGLLAAIPETRLAGLSGLVTCAGMLGLGLVDHQRTLAHSWEWMVFFTILWAIGSHLVMPVRSAIGMHLTHERRHGLRLGQVSSVGAAATIIGSAFAWVVSANRICPPYWLILSAGGIMSACGAVAFYAMHGTHMHLDRPRFIVRRQYWRYYALCLLFGARKQIFITFGPWVLIKIFHRQVVTFAKLSILNSTLTVFTNPFFGRLIDRWGERRVLMLDSLVLMGVCLGYGTAHLLGPAGVWLAFACFVLDEVMFGVGNARSTYMAKIAEQPDHVTASLSLGITLDHAISMTLPTLGGLVWVKYGHPWVFIGAGGIALLMLVFSSLIRVPERPAAAQ